MSTGTQTKDGLTVLQPEPDESFVSASETTPLLAASSGAGPAETNASVSNSAAAPEPADEKPLPVAQIILLCFARLLDPLSFFSIFPYINQMVELNGHGAIAASRVGFYSGLIESLFSLTQMIVMIFWGKLADRIGRKPVLVFSLVGVSVAMGLFGMAQEIWQMIMLRCLAGVFAGSVVTIRTMIQEHSTPKTQARSFSWFAFSGNMGIFLGPLLGGGLAEPAKQLGGIFSHSEFWKTYPYALPGFAVGLIGLVSAVTTAFFVKETLVKKAKPTAVSAYANGVANNIDQDTEVQNIDASKKLLTTWELMKAPGVGAVLYLFGHIFVLAFAYTAIAPVFWYTPIDIGGLNLTSFQISLFLAETGISQALWVLVIFPPLQHRIGTNGVIRLCAYVYPIAMGLNVPMQLLLRWGTASGNTAAVTAFWVIGPFFFLLMPGISMCFTAINLALNDVSPSQETMGALNGIALSILSGLRSFMPALSASLFAVGVDKQILWGYLAWLVVVLASVGLAIGVRWLPKSSEKEAEFGQEGQEQRENGDES